MGVVADDQVLVRAGFKLILDAEEEIDIVGEASDGLEAVTTALSVKPDVVLMDIRMPGIYGLEATRRILRACPGSAVLVLSMLDDDESVLAAMRAGARGYVPKGAGQEELLAAIRTADRLTGGA